MAPIKSTFRFNFWHIVIFFLLVALITWCWFSRQIDSIDFQIDNLHK